LFKIAEIAQFSQAQLSLYEDSLKEYRDMFSVMETQRKKGEKKGRIEGKIEGKIEVAKELLKNGVTVDIISKSTGLTISKIKKLR